MLRQNRSEGSSTSRLSPKLPCYGLAGRPSNSATNNLPGTFSLRNHFSSSPLQTEVQESGPTRGAILFLKEPLFLMPPGRAGSPRGQPGKSGSQGDRGTLFEG